MKSAVKFLGLSTRRRIGWKTVFTIKMERRRIFSPKSSCYIFSRLLTWKFYVAGDVNHIKVGSETNIQDNTLVHVAKTNVSGNVLPTVIGNRVTIGRLWNLVCSRLHFWYDIDVLGLFSYWNLRFHPFSPFMDFQAINVHPSSLPCHLPCYTKHAWMKKRIPQSFSLFLECGSHLFL